MIYVAQDQGNGRPCIRRTQQLEGRYHSEVAEPRRHSDIRRRKIVPDRTQCHPNREELQQHEIVARITGGTGVIAG